MIKIFLPVEVQVKYTFLSKALHEYQIRIDLMLPIEGDIVVNSQLIDDLVEKSLENALKLKGVHFNEIKTYKWRLV